MKILFGLLLAGSCGVIWAQTNAPAQIPQAMQIMVGSDSGHFDGNTMQMIYLGHVFATGAKSTLHCDQLTVALPPDGGHPTNIVAESKVVIDVLDEKGQTNHITAEKAVYIYNVVNAVTNEMITFTGGQPQPKVENPQFIIEGDSLVLNLVTRQFSGSNYRTIFKQNPNGGGNTNAALFNFFK